MDGFRVNQDLEALTEKSGWGNVLDAADRLPSIFVFRSARVLCIR